MTNEISAPDFVTLFITDKKQRQTFIDQVLQSVESGNLNPLDVHLGLKCFEKITEGITKDAGYKESLNDAVEKYGSKAFEYKGAKIESAEVGVKYDYSVCNDAMLNELQSQVERLNEAIKGRQTMLKTLPPEGIEILNDETGEVSRIYRPAKSSTTSLKVTM